MSEDNSEIESLKAKIKELEALLEKEKKASTVLIKLYGIIQDSYLQILEYNNQHVRSLTDLLKTAVKEERAVTNRELLDEVRAYHDRYRKKHKASAQKIKELN